jgi:hypothetical protein
VQEAFHWNVFFAFLMGCDNNIMKPKLINKLSTFVIFLPYDDAMVDPIFHVFTAVVDKKFLLWVSAPCSG